MKRLMALIGFLLFALVHHTMAQEPAILTEDSPGWHKIGEVTASFKTESESISVIGNVQMKAIKLRVTDASIDLNQVIIIYASGETEEISVSGMLKAGGETGEFKLKRPPETLQKVMFTYKSEPNVNENKAHVELYGLK